MWCHFCKKTLWIIQLAVGLSSQPALILYVGKHYIFTRIRLSAWRRYIAAGQFCILDRWILKESAMTERYWKEDNKKETRTLRYINCILWIPGKFITNVYRINVVTPSSIDGLFFLFLLICSVPFYKCVCTDTPFYGSDFVPIFNTLFLFHLCSILWHSQFVLLFAWCCYTTRNY